MMKQNNNRAKPQEHQNILYCLPNTLGIQNSHLHLHPSWYAKVGKYGGKYILNGV